MLFSCGSTWHKNLSGMSHQCLLLSICFVFSSKVMKRHTSLKSSKTLKLHIRQLKFWTFSGSFQFEYLKINKHKSCWFNFMVIILNLRLPIKKKFIAFKNSSPVQQYLKLGTKHQLWKLAKFSIHSVCSDVAIESASQYELVARFQNLLCAS